MVLYTKVTMPSHANLLFAASQGTTGGLFNWSWLLRNSRFVNAVTRTWPSELQSKANMMARLMRTDPRFVSPAHKIPHALRAFSHNRFLHSACSMVICRTFTSHDGGDEGESCA
ncbi:unnamed protein product [Orchesella dallaii]|uniref:Uncharacterized protein n=1 Tax=Orchesella dallaii TaxID=48710 RepID=A0ABP1RNW8_9HEXA